MFGQECGQLEYTEQAGEVTSPGYPADYPADVNCVYTISSDGSKVVNIFIWKKFQANY